MCDSWSGSGLSSLSSSSSFDRDLVVLGAGGDGEEAEEGGGVEGRGGRATFAGAVLERPGDFSGFVVLSSSLLAFFGEVTTIFLVLVVVCSVMCSSLSSRLRD